MKPGERGRPDASDGDLPLRDLDRELRDMGVEVELCVISGAVLPVVFRRGAGTRRPAALFAALEALRRAAGRVGAAAELEPGWLAAAARISQSKAADGDAFEGESLTVFRPRPEYALALRSAWIPLAPV